MYSCSECQADLASWSAQCPFCSRWGTLNHVFTQLKPSAPASRVTRFSTGSKSIDEVLGGGLVRGALYLLGGDPGAGKSTLALQVALMFSLARKTFYATSEETARMIVDRAYRVTDGDPYQFEKVSALNVLAENDIDSILEAAAGHHLFIDSLTMLQTESIKSPIGSPNQAKVCTDALMRYAREHDKTVFIVGQVTKEGGFAGPKMVEHLVDCLLFLEWSGKGEDRRLSIVGKNRYGRADLACDLLMNATGFQDAGNEKVESGSSEA